MLSNPRILLADSDTLSRKRIQCLLKRMGYNVEEVRCEDLPHHVLDADVVLCSWEDWRNGQKCASPQGLLPHFPPVVLVGHSPEDADWRQAFGGGAFDLVEEPHTPETVREFQRVVRDAIQFREEENGSACCKLPVACG